MSIREQALTGDDAAHESANCGDVSAVFLDHLTLAPRGRPVLEGVNAAIRQGEFVGVFGPNGAGKTTLLRAILGLQPPVGGAIKVLGRRPRRGNPAIGYMPQTRTLNLELRLRARDFVAAALHGGRWGWPRLGRRERDEVSWALATVEAERFADRGLAELSGGERQRLLLAQALLERPRLLLLDEPLSGLDIHYQGRVAALVRRVQSELGATVLFTAHELNALLGVMDRVLYLGGGQLALGSVDEVVRSEVLSPLFGTQVEVIHHRGRVFVVPFDHGNRCDPCGEHP